MNWSVIQKLDHLVIVAAHPFMDGWIIFTKSAVLGMYEKGSKLEKYVQKITEPPDELDNASV